MEIMRNINYYYLISEFVYINKIIVDQDMYSLQIQKINNAVKIMVLITAVIFLIIDKNMFPGVC